MTEQMVRITIRVPQKLLRKLKRKAKLDTKPVSQVIREGLKVYVQNWEGP